MIQRIDGEPAVVGATILDQLEPARASPMYGEIESLS